MADTPPLGVKLYAGYTVLVSALLLLLSLLVHPLLFVVVLCFIAVELVAVYGLWVMATWGWWLAVGLKLLGILFAVGDGNVIGLLMSLLILGYLFTVRDLY